MRIFDAEVMENAKRMAKENVSHKFLWPEEGVEYNERDGEYDPQITKKVCDRLKETVAHRSAGSEQKYIDSLIQSILQIEKNATGIINMLKGEKVPITLNSSYHLIMADLVGLLVGIKTLGYELSYMSDDIEALLWRLEYLFTCLRYAIQKNDTRKRIMELEEPASCMQYTDRQKKQLKLLLEARDRNMEMLIHMPPLSAESRSLHTLDIIYDDYINKVITDTADPRFNELF